MKLIAISYTVVAIAFASLAFGGTDSTDTVASVLREVKVSTIAKEGKVLKRMEMFPKAFIIVGIPVKVQTDSACTRFVGHENVVIKNKFVKIRALGSRDPLHDACIEIMPAPIETVLSVEFAYDSTSVGLNRTLERVIQIESKNFLVTIDLESEQVKISPIFYDTLR